MYIYAVNIHRKSGFVKPQFAQISEIAGPEVEVAALVNGDLVQLRGLPES
jgi:hypothetical protein